MAPKRVAANVASKVVTPAKKPVDDNASLLEKDAAAEPALNSKQKRPRSIDDAVAKCLKDNFEARGWSTASYDFVIRDGLPLREAVKAAKLKYEVGDEVMGKSFNNMLRLKYSDADSPMVRMVVEDPAQLEDEHVIQAIDALTKHRSDKSVMLSLWASNHIPNQKSLVAMFRAVCEAQPQSSSANADFFVDLLAYIVRNSLHTRFPKLFAEMKSRMDLALEKHWLGWKAAGLQPRLWLDMHSPYIHAMCDRAVLTRCFEQKNNWMDVADELREVVKTAFGIRIFLDEVSQSWWFEVSERLGRQAGQVGWYRG